ncbi:MAG: hypothetical protein ACYC46_00170 [Acidobacteriaceae bacterium]
MHDFLIAIVFVGMIVVPAMVATRSSSATRASKKDDVSGVDI